MAFPTIVDASNTQNDATVYNSTSDSILNEKSITNRSSIMVKKPYLVWQLDDTTMKIEWQMSSTMPCVLSWGADLSYSIGRVITNENSSSLNEHRHSYLITNLIPGTLYYYKVEENMGGIFTSQFRAPNGSATEVKLFVIGDKLIKSFHLHVFSY